MNVTSYGVIVDISIRTKNIPSQLSLAVTDIHIKARFLLFAQGTSLSSKCVCSFSQDMWAEEWNIKQDNCLMGCIHSHTAATHGETHTHNYACIQMHTHAAFLKHKRVNLWAHTHRHSIPSVSQMSPLSCLLNDQWHHCRFYINNLWRRESPQREWVRRWCDVSCCVLGQGRAGLPLRQGTLMQLRVFAYTMCPLPSAQRHRDCARHHPPIQLSCLFSVFTPPPTPICPCLRYH